MRTSIVLGLAVAAAAGSLASACTATDDGIAEGANPTCLECGDGGSGTDSDSNGYGSFAGSGDGSTGGFFDGGKPGPPPLQPSFGPVVTASVAPPPISGGTLLVLNDGKVAVASDPDRDAVYVVDVPTQKVLFSTALQTGDEPGRLVEDAAGRVHVALRGGGALVTIDPITGAVLARRAVCPAPRGVAYDASSDAVWVACATGELVSLAAGGGPASASFVVERDLRDVIVQSGTLAVSEFRSAQVLQVFKAGGIASRTSLATAFASNIPQVAWRMVGNASGELAIAHQEESTLPVTTQQPGAYGAGGTDGGSSGMVDSVLTVLGGPGGAMTLLLPDVVLPVDVALSSDGARAAVVATGNTFLPGMPNVELVTLAPVAVTHVSLPSNAQPTAVAFDGAGDILVQTREPAALWIVPPGQTVAQHEIPLSTESRADTGHAIFHTLAGAPIACASCHPEGGDDGHVWMLDGEERRTPSLRGTIAGTAPYHWPGTEPSFVALANDVYTIRMSGAQLDGAQLTAIQGWVEAIPAPSAPSWLDSAAVQRGQALFARSDVGCSSCHSGAKFTNNATVDVGTGSPFQVPPLVGVGWRTPLLHDGCAATMADRFGKCATPQHGSTSSLTAQDLSDLGAYLESL